MRYRNGRRSVCVSSQSGCPLTCTFCATGTMRFGRNLTRVARSSTRCCTSAGSSRVDHLVFMGMGEPGINMDAVLAAAAGCPTSASPTAARPSRPSAGCRGSERLAESDMPLRLAFSLHAPDDALRSRIMPVNDRYPIADVLAACAALLRERRRRVFIEYVMLAGVNDAYGQALALAELLDPRIYKVNLIPYNPTGAYDGLLARRDRRVQGRVGGARPARDRRLTRGRDIDAACGQLAAKAA